MCRQRRRYASWSYQRLHASGVVDVAHRRASRWTTTYTRWRWGSSQSTNRSLSVAASLSVDAAARPLHTGCYAAAAAGLDYLELCRRTSPEHRGVPGDHMRTASDAIAPVDRRYERENDAIKCVVYEKCRTQTLFWLCYDFTFAFFVLQRRNVAAV